MNTEQWSHQCYSSGTQVVTSNQPDTPWFYIYGPGAGGAFDSEAERDRNRFAMCEDLAAFLNGGERPAWLDDMHRICETELVGLDGSKIFMVGPTRSAPEHPYGWEYRDDPDALAMQARLIDRLCGIAAGKDSQ